MTGIDKPILLGGQRYRLREVTADDAPAVLSLFETVFGERPPDGWYAWKYGETGLRGRALGLWDEDGALVAHYAGFPRRLLWHGQPVDALQIGDVMVAREKRGLLTRRGPFFQVAVAFFAQWVGTDRPFALAFGFPNERAIRLGVRLGLYQDLGSVKNLRWPARMQRHSWLWHSREIFPDDADFESRIDTGWQEMQRNMSNRVLGVRNAAYLRARYINRPGITHHFIHVARRGYGPAAVAVARPAGTTLRWLDFIGPRSALAATAAALQGLAARLGLEQVETWASSAAQVDLLASGAEVAETAAYFALALVSVCPDETLGNKGWWLAGDTDFL
jgi:hypothetical protein